jgi:hypothetical protein
VEGGHRDAEGDDPESRVVLDPRRQGGGQEHRQDARRHGGDGRRDRPARRHRAGAKDAA